MNLVNPTSLVYFNQYLDSKGEFRRQFRESHEYIRLIDSYKINQQPLQCAPHPYIVMGETKHSYMLFLICSCTLNVHVLLFQSLLLFAKYSAHAR